MLWFCTDCAFSSSGRHIEADHGVVINKQISTSAVVAVSLIALIVRQTQLSRDNVAAICDAVSFCQSLAGVLHSQRSEIPSLNTVLYWHNSALNGSSPCAYKRPWHERNWNKLANPFFLNSWPTFVVYAPEIISPFSRHRPRKRKAAAAPVPAGCRHKSLYFARFISCVSSPRPNYSARTFIYAPRPLTLCSSLPFLHSRHKRRAKTTTNQKTGLRWLLLLVGKKNI